MIGGFLYQKSEWLFEHRSFEFIQFHTKNELLFKEKREMIFENCHWNESSRIWNGLLNKNTNNPNT